MDQNESSPTFRQSPLQVSRIREFLEQHIPDAGMRPFALQHVFQEGDVLWLPLGWLHMIETDVPGDENRAEAATDCWASLNLFYGR